MAQEIALRIYGGGLSTGFESSPLVSVGTAPAGYAPMPPVVVDEELSWMISHTQSHTIYALYSRHCQTASGEAGQLLISLFFPAQKRLADNASPLGLLNSISDFVSVQVLQGGALPTAAADPSPFIALLKRYPLEDRPLPLPVMEGRESVAFCVENPTQLDALMRHSRYAVLASIGRLELGMHCPSTIKLSTTGNTTKRTASINNSTTETTSLTQDVEMIPDFQSQPSGKGWNVGKMLAAAMALGVLLLLCFIYFNYNGNHQEQPTIAEDVLAEGIPVPMDSPQTIVNNMADMQTTKEKNPQPAKMATNEARAEILDLVNQKDLAACRRHPGWSSLNVDERAGIEAVLDLQRYKGKMRKVVEQLIRREMPFKSMREIRIIQKEIWRYHMEEDL